MVASSAAQSEIDMPSLVLDTLGAPSSKHNPPKLAYGIGKSMELIPQSNPSHDSVSLTVEIFDHLCVDKNRRSQIIVVRLLQWNGVAIEHFPCAGSVVVAKLYDPVYYIPTSGEWVGSSEEYSKFLHNNEVTAYTRLRDLYGKSIPRFFGAFKYYVAMEEDDRWVDLILIELVRDLHLTVEYEMQLEEARHLKDMAFRLLEQIHSSGVYHNDIGGRNLFWDRRDRLLLMDFEWATFDTPEGPARDEGYMLSTLAEYGCEDERSSIIPDWAHP
jgi:hypothetical protein